MAAQLNIALITCGLLPLESVCICNGCPSVGSLFVDNTFCGGCTICPLIVAVNIGMCHWTPVVIDHC